MYQDSLIQFRGKDCYLQQPFATYRFELLPVKRRGRKTRLQRVKVFHCWVDVVQPGQVLEMADKIIMHKVDWVKLRMQIARAYRPTETK